MAGLFECHDKSRFRLTAISTGPDDGSEMRQRLIGAFEQFLDVRNLNDGDVARLIKKEEIDILIDLKGFTNGGRIRILSD